jgi:uncharacterized protein involved in exopolysaccharide biosynthesis
MKSKSEHIRLLRPFFRGLPIIVMMMAGASWLASRYLRYATPLYESTVKIRLADTKDGAPSSNLYKDFDVFANANKIGTEMEVIKSKVLLNKVLDRLSFDVSMYRVGQMRKIELYHQSPVTIVAGNHQQWFDKLISFEVDANGSVKWQFPGETAFRQARLDEPTVVNGDSICFKRNQQLLQSRPDMKLADHYAFTRYSRQKLIESVLAQLEVSSIDKEIPVLRITFKSPVAAKAADFVNTLAQTYIEDYIETKYKSANTTEQFLNQQLQDVQSKLSASENAIERYRDQNRIINIRQETETDLRKIADMKVQQTNVRMNLEAIEDLNRYMRSGKDILELAPNFEAYTDLLATELIKKMKLLQAQKKELLIKYTPEHELVKVIDDQLKDITAYLQEGIDNTRKNLQVKYDRISTDIATAEMAFNGLPTKEKTMGILSRNFMLNEQTYNFLQGKHTEARIAGAANISFHRIISYGEIPKDPVSPNHTLIKVLAVFLAFLGSVMIIYAIHALKGKVNDQVNIEKNVAIPVAVQTPHLRKPEQIQRHFHKMGIQLYIKELLQANQVLCISSFLEHEGKTFNAVELATEMTRQGKRILLLDMQGLMPKNSLGFDCRTLSDIPSFHQTGQIVATVNEWKLQFDLIIILNESIQQASMGLLLMKLADANLFVMDSRRTPARLIAELGLLQEEYQLPRLQILLNRAGYQPNVLVQVYETIQQWMKRLKKTTHA